MSLWQLPFVIVPLAIVAYAFIYTDYEQKGNIKKLERRIAELEQKVRKIFPPS